MWLPLCVLRHKPRVSLQNALVCGAVLYKEASLARDVEVKKMFDVGALCLLLETLSFVS